ncbi:MAG: hypothetical protein Q4G03_12230, partial [Planctomycetia bacterium]|nr:hypothetical protein [Planctomycetia bacterium]
GLPYGQVATGFARGVKKRKAGGRACGLFYPQEEDGELTCPYDLNKEVVKLLLINIFNIIV